MPVPSSGNGQLTEYHLSGGLYPIVPPSLTPMSE